MCTSVMSQHNELIKERTTNKPLSEKSSRRVQFSDVSSGSVHAFGAPASEMTKEEKALIWWTDDEKKEFQKNARLLALEVKRREIPDHPKGYKLTMETVFKSCDTHQGPSKEQRHFLRQWTKAAFSRRGLERWTLDKMAITRFAEQRQCIKDVLHVTQSTTLAERSERMREVSEKASRRSRIFAALVAEGDAYATKEATPQHRGSIKNSAPTLHRSRPQEDESAPESIIPKEKRAFQKLRSNRTLRIRRKTAIA